MKVELQASDLTTAVAAVARFLPSRPVSPAVGGIRIDVADGLRLSAFDYETACTIDRSCDAGEPGSVLVSGRALNDMTNGLRGSVTLHTESGRLHLVSGSGVGSLPTLDLSLHAALPSVPPLLCEVDGAVLDAAVRRVGSAADNGSGGMESLRGLQISVASGVLSLGATDRYRLAFEDVPATVAQDVVLVLPAARQVADALKGAVGTAVGTVRLHGDDNLVGVTSSDRQVILRQISDERLPDVARFRCEPSDTIDLLVDRDELVDAIKVVAPFAADRQPLNFTLTASSLEVSVESERGTRAVALDATWGGDTYVVKFSGGYVTTALACLPEGVVRFRPHCTNPVRPVYLDAEDSPHTHIVMPVRGL